MDLRFRETLRSPWRSWHTDADSFEHCCGCPSAVAFRPSPSGAPPSAVEAPQPLAQTRLASLADRHSLFAFQARPRLLLRPPRGPWWTRELAKPVTTSDPRLMSAAPATRSSWSPSASAAAAAAKSRALCAFSSEALVAAVERLPGADTPVARSPPAALLASVVSLEPPHSTYFCHSCKERALQRMRSFWLVQLRGACLALDGRRTAPICGCHLSPERESQHGRSAPVDAALPQGYDGLGCMYKGIPDRRANCLSTLNRQPLQVLKEGEGGVVLATPYLESDCRKVDVPIHAGSLLQGNARKEPFAEGQSEPAAANATPSIQQGVQKGLHGQLSTAEDTLILSGARSRQEVAILPFGTPSTQREGTGRAALRLSRRAVNALAILTGIETALAAEMRGTDDALGRAAVVECPSKT
eukprot:scaffold1741_cov262-Pinguiococcus_pyrenoidosus.AAC.35